MSNFTWPFGDLEQFVQIGSAGPDGVDAGDLIDKSAKLRLYKLGLVEPQYGSRFRLTGEGLRTWDQVRRIIGYTDPWKVRSTL